jgi:hypothetical protein
MLFIFLSLLLTKYAFVGIFFSSKGVGWIQRQKSNASSRDYLRGIPERLRSWKVGSFS